MRTMTLNARDALFTADSTLQHAVAGRSTGTTLELTGPDSFIGDPVYNHLGDHLGSIMEIILEMQSGKIAYAVISQGEAFLTTGKMVAVPWDALEEGDSRNNRFLLSVSKKTIDNLPGFSYDNWPDMTDPAWYDQAFLGEPADVY